MQGQAEKSAMGATEHIGMKMVVCEDYKAKTVDELTIYKGEAIMILEQREDGWCLGLKAAKLGLFPLKHVGIFCKKSPKEENTRQTSLLDLTEKAAGSDLTKTGPKDQFSTPILNMDLSKDNVELKNAWVVLPLEDGGAVIAESKDKLWRAVRINREAATVSTLYATECPISSFILLPDNELLITQEDGIVLKIEVKNCRILDKYETSMEWLYDSTLDKDNLICVDFARSNVMAYNISNRHKEIKVEGLNNPTCITRALTDDGVVFVVCDCRSNRVNIYDCSWRLKTSIIGASPEEPLKEVWAATVTHQNTVLVADYLRHRISEYSLDGRFLCHVLRQEDGICYPFRMATCGDQLWVCCRRELDIVSDYTLKKYQIYQ